MMNPTVPVSIDAPRPAPQAPPGDEELWIGYESAYPLPSVLGQDWTIDDTERRAAG